MSDFIERQESKGISEINKFIDGLEEIFADLRERHVDDSVCGLCEYDGAYMGQSGDWCNECPGFDKDDCFKLSDETRKKWIEEIVNAYPDHTADIGKKVSISCSHENDLIFRQTAIDAMGKAKWAKERLEELSSAQPETPPYVAEIESEYKKWVSMPHINKPLAKALYEVWKKHDRKDVSRNG